MTGDDSSLLCQKVLWANGPNTETWNWSVIILALVSLYITDLMRQKKKAGDLLFRISLGKLGINS